MYLAALLLLFCNVKVHEMVHINVANCLNLNLCFDFDLYNFRR